MSDSIKKTLYLPNHERETIQELICEATDAPEIWRTVWTPDGEHPPYCELGIDAFESKFEAAAALLERAINERNHFEDRVRELGERVARCRETLIRASDRLPG
jgi:hypothetical protein